MSWKLEEKKVNDKVSIAVLDIKSIDSDTGKSIDNLIVSICHGKNSINYDLTEVKKKLYRDLSNNGEVISDVKRGAIAEFFIHIYLNLKNFQQECFYLNLEEPKSIKKGFDGLYSLDDEIWIMESKSGLSSTKNISHEKKVNEAYNDLIKKFSSDPDENDPWRNAVMHAGNEDLKTSESIKNKLRICAKKFSKEQPININEYNLIPSSTIYIVDNSYSISQNVELFSEIELKTNNMKYNKILVICVTQHSLETFTDYLSK